MKLTKGQLSRIENGLVSSPVSTLTRIAAALDVGPGVFFQSDSTTPRAVLVKGDGRNEDGSISPWDPHKVHHLAKRGYDFEGIAPAMGYSQEITNACNQLGWGVYQTDHKDANGQFEVNFQYSDALTTADRFTLAGVE